MTNTKARRVGIYGSGRAAGQILHALASSRHTLTAAIVFFDEQAGQDIGTLMGDEPVGITTTTDLEGAVRSGQFNVLLYAGLSGEVLYKTMELCAEFGVDLVHACFVHPRLRLAPELYARLQEHAAETGSRIVGTGMLPGLWLDVVPALLTSALPTPVSIVGESLSDITTWGYGVLNNELGIGQPPAPPGSAEGHASKIGLILRESAEMIAEALGLEGAQSEERGGLVIAEASTEVLGIQVRPGDRVGFDVSAVIVHGGKERVRIAWKGVPRDSFPDFEPALRVKAIGGDGTEIVLDITRPMDPYPGTAARFIHAITGVQSLPGGLHTPVQLSI